MKLTRILLSLLIVILPILALAEDVSDRPYTLVGSQVITPTVSTALTVPTDATWALVSVRSKAVHVEFDATAATTSDLPMPANTVFKVVGRNQIVALRFLDTSDGASTVYAKFFKAERP